MGHFAGQGDPETKDKGLSLLWLLVDMCSDIALQTRHRRKRVGQRRSNLRLEQEKKTLLVPSFGRV
jgi:hypothetical protein